MASSCVHLRLCAFLLCGSFTHGVEPAVAASEECAQPPSDDHGSDEVPIGAVEFLQVGHQLAMPRAAAKENVTKHTVASPNGLLYECDPARLDDLCYFISTSDDPVGPHNADLSVAEDGFRAVADVDGNALSVSPKPWTEGTKLVASTTELDANLDGYAKAFELVAPLRDAMMFAPETISDNEDRWNLLTQAFKDCHVKDADEIHDGVHALSRDNVYQKLKNPAGNDIHHFVLQFLEEGAIDLVCVMTDLDGFERCPAVRDANGIIEPATTSNCWEAAYAKIDDIHSAPATAPAPAPAQSTSAPPPAKPSPAPAPSKPAKR